MTSREQEWGQRDQRPVHHRVAVVELLEPLRGGKLLVKPQFELPTRRRLTLPRDRRATLPRTVVGRLFEGFGGGAGCAGRPG